ncbi:MAG: endopeptidase La [Flammeovirgaceae bacterium]|nr:endopeptidase La [Flammeovirgaceae bacterium]MBE60918.1 endopeptidase La [Flammeovirgaceae bacterium]MBR09252.1 endopeptidase La [Rickettsiales bacterium]|tara:strand:- start:3260 stop:5728 length:2469 start_codon:yes stop_codon:yes gene_type:complete
MFEDNSNEPIILSDLIDDESGELIQLVSEDDEGPLSDDNLPDELPILPIKNTVLFPGVVIPITVSRNKSIKLVKKAYKGDRIIGVLAQKNYKKEEAAFADLYDIGTVAKILKMLVLPDGNTTIIIQGRQRFKLGEALQEEPFLKATYQVIEEEENITEDEMKAITSSLKEAAYKVMKLNPEIPKEAQVALENIQSYTFLTHFLSSNVNADVSDKQKLLETNEPKTRAELLLQFMLKDIQMLELKQEIASKVHSDIDQQQKEYFLRQQMKVLQDELGQDGPDQEINALRQKAKDKKWPDEVKKHFAKELDKIGRMNPAAAEYPVAMSYAELLVDLPWDEGTEDNFDLKHARKVLDRDHFGLEKVKERILEYLAVRKLKNDLKGPILCLYGPPGVGKTSLGKSIADALGRKYVRMALGGVHDEAEIRGHRKTYIGAMPGKIIQNINKSKSSNPVFILDEIDKVSSDFRGDPSSALLEVLDPEQNSTFKDNYLEVDYDLSKVLFIATANSLESIQPPLRDRMEIIDITGYTLEEKVEIAKKHLIPKQRDEHGLKTKDVSFDKSAITKLVNDYTRESGVRSLERKVAAVIRNIAKSIAMEEEYDSKITDEQVRKILGAEVFDKEAYEDNKTPGVVTGLAWTPAGGDILFIETSLSRGKGKLTLSGQLGDVMKESAMTALSYLKTHAESLGIDYRVFEHYDLHVHVPAGAIPKDGPSAGITMLTSLASVYTQRLVKKKLAMTGEITLRGKVLPVGGIKEKILAARRAGIKEIIMCERNKKDLEEVNEKYIKGLEIHFVSTVEDVLEIALLNQKAKDPMEFILPEPGK